MVIVTGVFTVEMGVLTRGEIIQVDMLTTESRCATQERVMWMLLEGLLLWRADGEGLSNLSEILQDRKKLNL